VSECSTYRWLYAGCDECGAQAGEVRLNVMDPDLERALEVARGKAIAEWNRRFTGRTGRSDEARAPADNVENLSTDIDQILSLLGLDPGASRADDGALDMDRLRSEIVERDRRIAQSGVVKLQEGGVCKPCHMENA
jgi:hypothetical protein